MAEMLINIGICDYNNLRKLPSYRVILLIYLFSSMIQSVWSKQVNLGLLLYTLAPRSGGAAGPARES